MGNIYVKTEFAEKLWLHGRTLQLLTRLHCHLRGHRWGTWHWDWPEEDLSEFDIPATPPPRVVLMWLRGCERGRQRGIGCGGIQTCHARLDQKEELPS